VSGSPEDPEGENDVLPQVVGAKAPWLPRSGAMPEDHEAPASKPVPRWLHSAAAVNGGMVVFGGVSRGWELLGDAWLYDPTMGNERWYCLWGCPPAVYAFLSPETGVPQLSVGLTTEELERLQQQRRTGELQPGTPWGAAQREDGGGTGSGSATSKGGGTGGAQAGRDGTEGSPNPPLGLLPYSPEVMPREGHTAVVTRMALPRGATELKAVPATAGMGPGSRAQDTGLRSFPSIGLDGATKQEIMIVHGGLGPGTRSLVTMQETLAFIPTPTPKWYRIAGPPSAEDIIKSQVSGGDGGGGGNQ